VIGAIFEKTMVHAPGVIPEDAGMLFAGVQGMPTYEYACTKCGHTFEAVQSMNDKPLSRCPQCKSAVRRVINGGIGIIFRGSGFYTTDNKKSSALSGGNGSSKDKEQAAEKSPENKSPEKSPDKPRDSTPSESSSREKTAAS
jgi:putative FmdB family regulatory protein